MFHSALTLLFEAYWGFASAASSSVLSSLSSPCKWSIMVDFLQCKYFLQGVQNNVCQSIVLSRDAKWQLVGHYESFSAPGTARESRAVAVNELYFFFRHFFLIMQ